MLGLVVAYSKKDKIICLKGALPWNLEQDLHRFRDLTTGKAIVMGRKTYESIGRPLPNRLNIVVSRNCTYEGANLITVRSFEEAIKAAGDKDLMVSGGSSIYKEALPFVEVMYVTEVDYDGEGDAFFPDFDESLFDREEECVITEEELPYTFVTYRRK